MWRLDFLSGAPPNRAAEPPGLEGPFEKLDSGYPAGLSAHESVAVVLQDDEGGAWSVELVRWRMIIESSRGCAKLIGMRIESITKVSCLA